MKDHRLRVIRAGSSDTEAAILERLGRTIAVGIPGSAPPFRHQVLAVTLVNLLGSLFPKIKIHCHPHARAHPLLPPGPALLAERLEAARNLGHGPEECGQPEIAIGIGATDVGAQIYADAERWQSYTGPRPSRIDATLDRDEIAIGALCAAARAAARAYSHALAGLCADELVDSEVYWSALDYRSSTDPLSDPGLPAPRTLDALLVGGGSIGGAAAFGFAHTPHLEGMLALVDPQALDEHNYVRAILASRPACEAKLPKVEMIQAALAHHAHLEAHAYQQTMADFVAGRPSELPLPLVLAALDSIASRRSVQDSLPLEVVNAGCSANVAMVSGHVTGDGPCLYCIFLEQVLDTENVLRKLIARATGFDQREVARRIVQNVPLSAADLRAIERHREVAAETYAEYQYKQITELYQEALLYGEKKISAGDDEIAVAAPFITALAGFLLTNEALKFASTELQRYRIGVAGNLAAYGGASATKYEEDLFAGPGSALLMTLPRADEYCLCLSERRLALVNRRYPHS